MRNVKQTENQENMEHSRNGLDRLISLLSSICGAGSSKILRV